tara:strand:- start:56 stop:196 length:141 start_codon:yes stop_codon:yes gene_type:complete
MSFKFGNIKKAKFFDLNLINFSKKNEKQQNNNKKVLGNSFSKLLIL